MKEKRTLVSVLIALAAAVIAIVGAAAILGCAKDKLGTPQDVVVDDYEILRWSKVEGAEKYAIKINDVYYEAQSNELDIFELTDKVGSYTIEVMAFADGKGQSQPSEKVVVEVPSWSGKLAVAELNDGSGYLVEGIPLVIEGKVVIPSEVDGKPIVGFTEYGFRNCTKITSIIIPDTITSYGEIGRKYDPFANCTNLRRVKFSRGATTVKGFEGCEMLKEVNLPDEVEKFLGAFNNCSNLTKISLGKNFKNLGQGGSLQYCTELKEISVSKSNLYFRVENNCLILKNENSVYYGTAGAVIPDGISKIERNAFVYTGLTEITIPSSVEEIGESAFANCKGLTKVVFESGPIAPKLDESLFSYCENLETVILPNNIQRLPRLIFHKCRKIKVKLPASVIEIQPSSFRDCGGAEIEIDENNEVYSSEGNCIIHKPTKTLVHASDSSVIPSYITKIGQFAVTGLTLETFKVPENVVEIGENAFENCNNMKDIYLPEGLKKIGYGAFSGIGESFTSLTVPDSLEEVDEFGFAMCTVYTSRQPHVKDGSVAWTNVKWVGDDWYVRFFPNPPCSATYVFFGCELRYDGKYPYVYSITQDEYTVSEEIKGKTWQETLKYVDGYVFTPKREGYACIGGKYFLDADTIEVVVEEQEIYKTTPREPVLVKKGLAFGKAGEAYNYWSMGFAKGKTLYPIYEKVE